MADMTEEPDMAGTFHDATSDAALLELGEVRRRLGGVIAALETSGGEYQQAWRMLLAGEAAIEHAVGRLTTAKNGKHQAWQVRQTEAREFLVLRAEESGRVFRVPEERRYPGFIFRQADRLTFTLEKKAALDGRRYGTVARVFASKETSPGIREEGVLEMPLQTLHRAFLDGAIVEVEPPTEIKSGPALRLEVTPTQNGELAIDVTEVQS